MPVKIGIDMSVNSPGIAVLQDNILTAWFYPHRKREIGFNRVSDVKHTDVKQLRVVAFPGSPLTDEPDFWTKAKRIATDLRGIIQGLTGPVEIQMEGYAFDAISSSATKIHELGGVVKYQLAMQGIQWIEIAPTSLKKKFTGNGKADKVLMLETFIQMGFPDLMEYFSLSSTGGKIPNPVQDIVDASALVLV
jgi:Holliday junction resolvasome RuvABC endonuclease subunit